MKRQKRPFYIIGHNPNTIEEAKEFLSLGANGLEPDIRYADGQFYVSHNSHSNYDEYPTVENYLKDLKQLLLDEKYNLALILFDMKETIGDLNHLVTVIKENFSGGVCDGVTIILTHSDDTNYLNTYNGNYENIGVGVDESNEHPSDIEIAFLTAGQKNFAYADGITTLLNKPGVYKNITEALQCRDKNITNSFKLIYTWVLSLEASIRKYLNAHIDGIFVDVATVEKLKKIIKSAPYNNVYELAQNGYNPFTAHPIPKYKLVIKTKDQHLAGTDATILFILTGTKGVLKSLPYNGNLNGALERNTITYVTLEGADVGEIQSLTIEALTADINSDWLPEIILVESNLLTEKVNFIFNNDTLPAEWVSKKNGPVTKYIFNTRE